MRRAFLLLSLASCTARKGAELEALARQGHLGEACAAVVAEPGDVALDDARAAIVAAHLAAAPTITVAAVPATTFTARSADTYGAA